MRSSNSDNSLETLIGGLGLDDETIAVVRAIAGEASALPSDAVELATTLLDRFGPRPKGWESARLTRARNGLHGWLDAATTGPSRGSAILRQPRTIALTFGGQGADWMLELAELWSASAAAQRVITVGINALQQCFDSLTDADRAPYKHGLDVAEWIATPASRPGAEYLASAPITFPMVFIVQAAQLARMVELGLDRPAFRDRVVASAGHSQGVVAAVYAAETWRHEEPWLRAADYVRLTFFLGLRPHQLCRTPAPSASVLARCQQEGHDAPAPMAAVTGPDTESLQSTLDALGLPIVIGLRSTRYRHVVSGKPQHLEWLRIALEAQEDSARKARAKGRLPGRLARLVWAHLPIGRAYHSPDMVDAAERVKQDLRGMAIRAVDLAFTALDTETSAELSGDDIVEQIIDLCCIKPARWDDNVAVLRTRGVGCILDFGPSDGVMRLTGSNLKGFDVAVLGMTRPDHREALLDVARAPRPRVTPFASHRPGRAADGQVVNRFTRWTGMPPVLLPGMTPTTMDAPIVAAAANAGFMSELAGGGQVTEPILRTRMDELQAALIPGRGIVFNALYLDPYLWRLHFGGDRPLVARLRDEGYPIIGVTVSAGIPPLDEAVALLQTLAAHGIWLNSLKPGTHEQIKSVLAIADATPELTLLVQIEGGKAGGHHSWEDLEDLLDTWYGALRARDNIVLAVGGGVGDEQRAADLISGTWSEHLGRPPMPVDAVFPGTVCMAAEEAATSAAVKDAMCQAKGTDRILTDGAREGGITSGRSGLDAPIYYLDNSAAAAGRLLDSLAGDAEAIAARRDAIIQALDRTAKPYFGDVAGMTWTDVLRRYVTLSAVGLDSAYEDGVWPDKAYRTRFVALLQRAESRLTHVPTRSISDDGSQPWSVLEQFIARYGADDTVAIGDEEARFFLQTCRLAGKPVCFVPVIDQDVRRWFKSDSLWQAQHAGYAADAVLTIPGPAAVAGMRQEPIASILGRFDAAARKAVASAPTVDFEQPEPRLAVDPATGRVFGLPSVRSIISGGAGLDLQLRQADGVLLWDRAAWLDAQRSFYADIFDPGYTLDVEAFRVATDDDGYGQPINTAFALTWRAIFDVLTGPAVGGVDLLSLLHEGNVIETGAAWPPATDGRQQTDAELVAVDRTPTGRRIVVRARLTVDDTLSATVTSTFFVRGEESAVGRLRCGAQTFSLQLDTQAELAFLAERPWVTLSETPSLPCALELDCDQWLDRDGRFEAQGRLVVGGVTIGAVSYVGSGQGEHPVAAACALLAAPDTERVLTTPRELGRKRLVAPKDMRAYADASGDRNAIHLDPAMAGLAGLDGVVVHGMWTASAALHRVARLAAGGDSSRITRADVRFVDMVSPGDELVVEARQTALREGAAIVQLTVRALRDDGPIVLTGTAEIAPARTAWAFPGQGIQKPGMGMAVRDRSRAARAVWDRAEMVCARDLGFSLLEIVRDNPAELMIRGETVRHPDGLLYLTQFTQVAMVVHASAQVAELKERGAFTTDAMLCGHSVGEYAALAAVNEVLPLEQIVPIVYARGLTMHTLVERDAEGRSPWAMGVMRPHACGMSEAEALALVETVREETGAFVQVVNFNVRGRQYSVTGDRRALDTLAERLNRGAGDRPAWVLVPGIDVPFHSSLLRSGVDRFRATMEASFPTQMAWRELVGRYVPNLVARPFELTEDFLRATLEACGSQRIAALLEQPLMADDATARIVLIELLAWQFASPVRWIETQELLLSRVERFVEVGVAHQPTVANMMRSTLKTLPAVHEPPAIFNAEADFDALLGPVVPYEQDALPQEASDGGAPEDESASGQAIAAAPVVARAPTSIPAGGDSIADIAVSPADALRTIVALHGRLRLDQITDTETLDELLGGNSARRNQVMADLGAELGPAGLDGAHELPLGTVAAAMTARAGYSGHGGYLAEAIDATLQRGVGAARLSRAVLSEYLTDEWCLGTGHVFQVVNRVALGARQGKATRGGELSALPADLVADRSTGLAWVDTVVSAYGQERGVALSKAAVVTPEGGAVVDSAALAALTAEIEARLTQTAEALAGSASGQSLPAPEVDEKAERLARYEAEHDQAYLDLIRPCFDPQKHLALTSAWAWIRRDAAEQTLTGQPATCDRTGSDFAGRTFVVTGAGPGSIALAMVKTLLAQGARVVLTTSRYRRERFKSYSAMYRNTAAHGAELHVVPCNQGSFEDVDAFCAWLSARWRPDTLVPFGAIGEAADLAGMGPRSLASLRVLMLGVERLVARIAEGLAVRPGAPAVALLPLSPNHGIFGGDGAYAEAKAGLETLLNKWHHEAWGRQIVVVGAQIGWVRGTGLMAHNDDVAQHLDGITTFAQSEMAAALLALVESKPVQGEVPAPTCADLTGGLKDAGSELATTVATVRAQAQKARATEQRRLVLEQALSGATEPVESPATTIAPAPVSRVDAPIPTAAELESFRPLGHLDLDRIVTIVGYGEVGPWGSHRTRWAAEQGLQLGLESVAELAWTMGLIRPAVKGAGWVDAASGEAVADKDLGERYEARVMENCGIRVVDPDLQGFDPRSALQYSDVHLEQDFAFEVNSREEAEAFREADPEHTEVVAREDGTLLVRRLAGTTIKVRRSLHLDRWAGGQVPSGWDATRFGISPEIVEQVDRVTLFLLVATAEAFLQAGLEPEEIYAFLHPTRVACTQASGIGGMRKQRRLNQDFELGNERQSDVLQETLINVISGWVVQSYLGSYGEMRFPVGACATASVSLAEGVDAIVGNKADMVVTGAVDDWTLEGQVGFADMGATASTQAMADKGIGPRELCRPNDRRRGGFVEAQGAGAMILCRASLALRAGLPVYGVVAYAATYGDGINRSVPAPGVGILGCMAERREAPWDPTSACDFEERRGAVLEAEQSQSAFEAAVGVERAERIVAQSRAHYGHDFWRGREDVAPLRGALAVLGLGADDIAFVSKHDTSTAANDPNEATLHDELQRRLGRSDKRPLMVVSQKSLTGHSKGSAAAWQLNGALQVMASGVIPGNLQLEDVDDYGQSLEHLCFTDRAIAAPRQDLKAALVTSLGFGHIGAIVALAHPFCFWSALSEADRASYQARIEKRLNGATRKLRGVLTGRQPLLTLRTERPFEGGVGSDEHRAHETEVLTDAGARRPVGAASFVRLVSSP